MHVNPQIHFHWENVKGVFIKGDRSIVHISNGNR